MLDHKRRVMDKGFMKFYKPIFIFIVLFLVSMIGVSASDYAQFTTNMTGYNTPAPYIATNSSQNGANNGGYCIFDGYQQEAPSGSCTGGGWQAGGSATGWVKLDLGSGNESRLTQYAICTYNSINYKPTAWSIEVSNVTSGANYTVNNQSVGLVSNVCTNFTINNGSENYRGRYITLTITNSAGGGALLVEEMVLYFNTTVSYSTPTTIISSPSNNTIQYVTANTFLFNTTDFNLTGSGFNTTERVYFENGSLYQGILNASSNVSNNITINSTGIYYINATSTNGSYVLNTSTYIFTLYNLFEANITSNTSIISSLKNVTWVNGSTTNSSVPITSYTLYLLYPNASFETLYSGLDNNFTFNAYSKNLILNDSYYLVLKTLDNRGVNVNVSQLLNVSFNAQLNITANNGSGIPSFSVNVTNLDTGVTNTYSTSSGVISLDSVQGTNYSLTLFNSGSAYGYANITLSLPYNVQNFILDPFNTIKVYSFLETDSSVLGVNASLSFVGSNNSFTELLNGSNANYSYIPSDTYTVYVSSVGYADRKYVVTVINGSSQILNIYMLPSNLSSVIGIYIKSLSDNIITGATVSIQQLVNTSYIGIAQGMTDGTGFVTFALQEGKPYRLVITANTYNVYYTPFVPYLANSPYTFKLSPTSGFVFTTLGDFINYAYSPLGTTINSTNETFSFTTYSLNGSVIYTYMDCDGNVQNVSGSPTGSTLSINLNVTAGATLTCQYGFDTVQSGFYSFNVTYIGYSPYPDSFASSGAKIKSLTNILWLTLLSYIIMCVVAIGMKRFYPDPRITGAIFCIGTIIFVSVGWINYVSGGVSATIGLLFLYVGSR